MSQWHGGRREAGKGSAPRKEQDNEAYRNNYDMIFGTKRKTKQDEKDSPRHRDEYENPTRSGS